MIRPFFSYYGGKWRDAPRLYPPPAHNTVIEPFAGSAGYAVRYADRRVVLCDLDPVIVGVWDYLIRVSPAELLAIPDVPHDGSVDDLAIPQEARWLVGFWLSRATPHPCRTPSAWMRKGGHPSSFWGPRVRRILAAQVPRIRHWRVYQCSYTECPVSGPATWFVDPPYQAMGRYYRHGSSGVDFADLGAWCRSREGRVIVCENVGADWLPFVPLGTTKTTRAGKRSAEAAWVRDSVPAEVGPLFAWRAA